MSHLFSVKDKNKKLVANHLALISTIPQTPKFMRNKLNLGTRLKLIVVDQKSILSLDENKLTDLYGVDYYGLKERKLKERTKRRVQFFLDLTEVTDTPELAQKIKLPCYFISILL